ncbi:hypothetical protein [Bacillus cereus]|uniref:Uncharacterized protein n=1 Tax=Bacillus cereus TaxID=1396 RepID=A0A164QF86_BACCE|nr:hypothetical protein [Bacillus cereus]KZD71236.1 hypothetical protein B4088_0966 [Bacillus cereus]
MKLSIEKLDEMKRVADNINEHSADGDSVLLAGYTLQLINELKVEKEENENLKISNNKIVERWIDSLINNVKVLDTYLPAWRIIAKPKIKQLTEAISKNDKSDQK